MSEAIVKKYKLLGFDQVAIEEDPPNITVNYHYHPAENIIHVLTGAIRINLNGHWKKLGPGQAVTIKHGQIHKSTIGPDGCRFIRAARY